MSCMDNLAFKWTTKPGNSETVVPLDSTYMGAPVAAAFTTASPGTYLTPGNYRNMWKGHPVIKGTVYCTDQNVTVYLQSLVGTDNDSSDWETDADNGTVTVTAGTPKPIEWKPRGDDFRIRIDAGATGPTILQARFTVAWNVDYGS